MLELWLLSFGLEALLIFVPLLWRFRRLLSVLLMAFELWTTLWLVWQLGWTAGMPLALLGAYRIINLARVVRGRMHSRYLQQAFARTVWWLFLIHIALVWSALLLISSGLGRQGALHLALYFQLVAACLILLITMRNLSKLRYHDNGKYLVDRELPTVSVAIPARNETSDLEACLRSVLASDYPKLEILVLDDCSQGKTADIIRGFAHDGVRFIPGEEPATRWLAKNQAYQKLFQEANGDIMLFCGVDVRFGPHAIRSLVNLMQQRRKSMISILPVRRQSSAAAALIQPMRYWWEVALPRRFFNRPPVLSTCWLIERKALKKLGGFGAVSHTILPEGVLARELIKRDKYSFVRSSQALDVQTAKSLAEQRETAIRMRYPQLHRRPELQLLLMLAQAGLLLAPFGLLLAAVWHPVVNPWLPAATCFLIIVTHVAIVQVTDPSNVPLALFNFPVVIITELIIGLASMFKYEFFTVSWKERNICIPIMHVVPHLPSLETTADLAQKS
ncbi:MAG TPA: glycosyltransferase family 2 protein [Patescibacteria group bacterium]|nr:glycosyltransferase family 2 protein [Patescibacteria group bacterium]